MPRRLPTPCAKPGCPKLGPRGRCADHQPEEYRAQDARRGTAAQRGYGTSRWLRLRRMVISRDPVCRACKRSPSTEADHVIPRALGGDDAMDNLQGLCKPCHSAKTARESLPRRGQARAQA